MSADDHLTGEHLVIPASVCVGLGFSIGEESWALGILFGIIALMAVLPLTFALYKSTGHRRTLLIWATFGSYGVLGWAVTQIQTPIAWSLLVISAGLTVLLTRLLLRAANISKTDD